MACTNGQAPMHMRVTVAFSWHTIFHCDSVRARSGRRALLVKMNASPLSQSPSGCAFGVGYSLGLVIGHGQRQATAHGPDGVPSGERGAWVTRSNQNVAQLFRLCRLHLQPSGTGDWAAHCRSDRISFIRPRIRQGIGKDRRPSQPSRCKVLRSRTGLIDVEGTGRYTDHV